MTFEDKESKDKFKLDSTLEIKIDENGNRYATRVKEYKSISQKVKEIEYYNGDIETTYVSDALVSVDFTDKFLNISGFGTLGSTELTPIWDEPGYNAALAIQVSWVQKTITIGPDTGVSYKITNVKSKFVNLASSIYPVSLVVGAQSYGRKYRDLYCTDYVGQFNRNLTSTYYASNSNLFSYKSLSSSYYDPYYTFIIKGMNSSVSGYVYGYIKRGLNGSTWQGPYALIEFD